MNAGGVLVVTLGLAIARVLDLAMTRLFGLRPIVESGPSDRAKRGPLLARLRFTRRKALDVRTQSFGSLSPALGFGKPRQRITSIEGFDPGGNASLAWNRGFDSPQALLRSRNAEGQVIGANGLPGTFEAPIRQCGSHFGSRRQRLVDNPRKSVDKFVRPPALSNWRCAPVAGWCVRLGAGYEYEFEN